MRYRVSDHLARCPPGAEHVTTGTREVDPLADLVEHVRTFLDSGLMLASWLEGLAAPGMDASDRELLRGAAADLAGRFWRQPGGEASLGFRAAFEILVSSAAAVGHDRTGHVSVSTTTAEEAVRRLEAFIRRRGFHALVAVYTSVSRYSHLSALEHAGVIAEEAFVRGEHRAQPWPETTPEMELRQGLADGDFAVVSRDGRRFVELAPNGRGRLRPHCGHWPVSGRRSSRAPARTWARLRSGSRPRGWSEFIAARRGTDD